MNQQSAFYLQVEFLLGLAGGLAVLLFAAALLRARDVLAERRRRTIARAMRRDLALLSDVFRRMRPSRAEALADPGALARLVEALEANADLFLRIARSEGAFLRAFGPAAAWAFEDLLALYGDLHEGAQAAGRHWEDVAEGRLEALGPHRRRVALVLRAEEAGEDVGLLRFSRAVAAIESCYRAPPPSAGIDLRRPAGAMAPAA